MSLNITDHVPIPRPYLSTPSHQLATPSPPASSYPRIHLTTPPLNHPTTKSTPRSPRPGHSPFISPGLPPIILLGQKTSGHGVPSPEKAPGGQNSKKAQEEKDQTAAGKLLQRRNLSTARPCTSLNSLRTIAASHYRGPRRLSGPSSGSKASPRPSPEDTRGLWTRHRDDTAGPATAESHGFDLRPPPQATGGMKKCLSQPAFYRPPPDEDYEEAEELSVGRGMSHDGKMGLRTGDGEDEARDGFDNEEPRPMERVFWWLSDVNALTELEPPPSPEDIVDAPTQTDTAIHVIHDED